ncbi:MAG: heavy metal translocating P-type ATPase [Calditerrivibrio sp.]|nr:heavy metal translocating P-type ATPase [Calditerrivibrio sp.]
MKKLRVAINGMTCAACSSRIEKKLRKTDGIIDVAINLPLNAGEVTYNDELISEEVIIKTINNLGYQAEKQKDTKNKDTSRLDIIKLIVGFSLSLPLFIGMIAHILHIKSMEFLMNPYLQLLLATPVQFFCGYQFYKGAFYNLKTGTSNMDLLVALGTSTAYFYSVYNTFSAGNLYFETSSILITLVLFGKYLEKRATGKASDAIKKLLEYAPKKAKLLKDDRIVEVDISEIKSEDILLVSTGDKVPVDGEIIDGKGLIDESMMTGEPIPVEKNVGESVIGGTINTHYIFKMKATSTAENTVLSQIIKLIENAQTTKAPIQRFADLVSGYFVPSVVLIAIVTFAGWYIITKDLNISLINAVAVLVISCPCALGLATPTSIMVASGISAKKGILFKDVASIENLNKIKAIIFDKTGTITTGSISVKKFVKLEDVDLNEVFPLVLTIESQSSHPLAIAIKDYLLSQHHQLVPSVKDIHEIPGKGMVGFYDKKEIMIGKPFKHIDEEPGSIVSIYIDNLHIGYFLLQDEIKADAKEVIEKFSKKGIKIYLLTGDNTKTAHYVASQVGIKDENVISGVLPHEKAHWVEKIKSKERLVAMVGDGINDSPALAVADIAIAMGNGTDIAIETASVIIIKGDLKSVYNAFKIGEYTIKNIKQNLFWAFIYNTVGIPLAAFGYLNPIIAGTAMAFSSVSVVSNALRLKKMRLEY